MTLAIDASTPVIAVNSSTTVATITTATFTPPAGALLLIRWSGDSATGPPAAPSITDNLGVHLTYALTDWQSSADAPAANGQTAIWWAVVGASAAMTVTVTSGTASGHRASAVHVTVITGQDPVAPIGAHGKAGSASAAAIAQTYTATATGGQGFVADTDWDALGAAAAGAGCTLTNGGSGTIVGQISYGFVRRTTADGTSGGTTTLNVTLPGTSTNLSWAYVEVAPAVVGGGTVGAQQGGFPRAVRTGSGTSVLTRPTADPPAASPLPQVVVASPIRPSPVAGQTALVRVRGEPYVDPPGWRQAPATSPAPIRLGAAVLAASRADPATGPDVPPVVEPVTTRPAPVPPTAGGTVLLRSTAQPVLAPVPEVGAPRASSAAGSASVVLLRSVADPVAAPDFAPTPMVVARPAALGAAPAPVATLTASRTDVVTDARAAAPVTVAGLSAGRTAGAMLLTRPAADLPQPTRPMVVTTAEPPHDRIRIGSTVLLCPPAGGLAVVTAGPGYLSGADTSENPLAGVAVAAYTIGAGADSYTTVLVGQSAQEWTLDSIGDRPEGGMS